LSYPRRALFAAKPHTITIEELDAGFLQRGLERIKIGGPQLAGTGLVIDAMAPALEGCGTLDW
jgi:hypothetical protein